MQEKSVIIIGAGLAGLSAGCYARMNGYKTRILEHHSKPGGVVAGWKRNGFLIDGGIHYLMDYKPPRATHQLYTELGILTANHIQQKDAYLRFLDEPTGKRIEITRDLDKFASDLKALSPQDSGLIDSLISAARAMQGLDIMGIGLSQPAELTGWLDKIGQIWKMRRLLKYMDGKYGCSVRDFAGDIKDPLLRRIIENLFLPDVPVFFITMLLATLADGQMGVLEEGSLHFAMSLDNRYRGLGGQIDYSSTVTRIIVEDNRAIGVQLENGRQFTADTVISAADGYSTIFQMLDGKYVNNQILDMYQSSGAMAPLVANSAETGSTHWSGPNMPQRRWHTGGRWKLFNPIMIINFGVTREFKGEPSISIITLNKQVKIGNQDIAGLSLRIFNHSPHFAPPGKTVVQVMAETDWDYWHDLRVNNRLQYDSEKQRVAGEILERLEAYYPGISSRIEVTDVATPYTMWRYTHNYKGAFEGWLPTPETFKTPLKMTLPGLGGFYMIGQWVMAGGGVPPCLYSGKHAVQILCYKDKKEFVSHKG
ncbi:MAG: NAD(P)/FAD-dependent oxidoreductase [Planctomycetes bacterium]|nr:NAD(P)/FAD-dependent oxidoreductase [Planctomycetota bacterium]